MKRLVYVLSLIMAVSFMLSACGEIESAGFDTGQAFVRHDTEQIQDIHVTLSEANGIADLFVWRDTGNISFSTKSEMSRSHLVSSSETVREDGQDLMYVFNYADGGFVIVGATRNYYPILAFSNEGSFVPRDDMGPIDVWLDETKVCIRNSVSLDFSTKAQMQKLWSRYDGSYIDSTYDFLPARRPQIRSTGEDACWERIDSLQALYGSQGWTFLPLSFVEDLFTGYGLSSYYADICYSATQNHSALNETIIGYKNPVTDTVGRLLETEWYQRPHFGKLCPNKVAGCGAVAAGQLMRYHQYPPTMTWDNETFTWSDTDIPAEPVSSSKQPHLMRMLGQKFQMEYRSDSTSATTVTKIVNGLDSLGYVATPVTHSTWSVKNEIMTGRRPVIMFGTEASSPYSAGHFWVCEGTIEIIYDAIRFYTENQPYGVGSFSQGMYSLNQPGTVGGSSFYHYFYMNWGQGEGDENGWFASNDVYVDVDLHPAYNRKNIYVSLPY